MVTRKPSDINQLLQISRRDFLKLIAVSCSTVALRPLKDLVSLPDFPEAGRLGRVCVGKIDLKSRPDLDSSTVGVLYEDAVVPWVREVAGEKPAYIFNNQRWVETEQGYVYGPYLQPVYNRPNQPVKHLPQESSLGPGMWAEVTVPYVDAVLDKKLPSSHSWVKARIEDGMPLRFYYSQVFWVDQIKQDDKGVFHYRVNPNYYGGVDMLWAPAEAFRPIELDELAPINPDSVNKHIEINVTHQTLSCYEGNTEIYFCRVSTGAKFDMYGNVVDKWATPVGKHRVTRKYISLQMSGGTTGAGYDLPGIGWTSIFATGGVAIHSTFWHHNYGDPVSHGCVNAYPEDAKWIFRWGSPTVTYDPGMVDVTVTGDDSTSVKVIE